VLKYDIRLLGKKYPSGGIYMYKRILSLLCVSILLSSFSVYAAAPKTINFQGRFIDNGSPKIGTDKITFKIYNVKDGGSALWTEEDNVSFEAGVFSISLGTISPLDINFNQDLWVEMMITSSSTTLSPRQRLNSVPYAFYANMALTAETVVSGGVPIGTVLASAAIVTPEGYLECAGQGIQRTTYPKLYDALLYTYGGAGGVFNVPDYRGYFLRGRDPGKVRDPQDVAARAGGDAATQVGSTQDSAFTNHQHTVYGYWGKDDSNFTGNNGRMQASDFLNAFDQSTSNANSGSASETRPKNVYVMYIIRAK
jgi:microcystin-dependent protein